MSDVERIVEERNARQNNKEPEPERNDDGSFADPFYAELSDMTEDDIERELLEDF